LTVRLKGLNPDAHYQLHNADTGETKNLTGIHLLRDGFSFTIPEQGGSTLWWLQRGG
jgi:hypothetical protein